MIFLVPSVRHDRVQSNENIDHLQTSKDVQSFMKSCSIAFEEWQGTKPNPVLAPDVSRDKINTSLVLKSHF